MVRLDFEEVTPLAVTEEEQLMTWLYNCVAAGLDGIILSDYKKGVLTDSLAQSIIKEANRAGIPVLVDPKGSDWTKYNGADFVTPNMKELSDCLGRPVANEGQAVVAALRPAIVGLVGAAALLLMNQENFSSPADPWRFYISIALFLATFFGVPLGKGHHRHRPGRQGVEQPGDGAGSLRRIRCR